jgi:predicted nucleotidyltransferase
MTRADGDERPRSRGELDEYCARLCDALRMHLGDRLVCVLLCGSWARGEERPGESDVDLVVVVDTVDEAIHDRLRTAWQEADAGSAAVIGADEVDVMSREGLEMYSANAILLTGINVFGLPTTDDFAYDLSRKAEIVAHEARAALHYAWLSAQERRARLGVALGKQFFVWGAMNWVALHTGAFPSRRADLHLSLTTLGGPQVAELLTVDPATMSEEEISRTARLLNDVTRRWFDDIRRYRESASGGMPDLA